MSQSALPAAQRLAVGLLASLLAVGPGSTWTGGTTLAAGSAAALVSEAWTLFQGYHEDLSRIDQARALLERVITRERTVDALLLLSWVHLAWADLRAQSFEQKLAGYERGRDVAKLATELAPRNPNAHLWYVANLGRLGTTRGKLRSAFLLPAINEHLRIILKLAPEHVAGLALAGSVALETPPFFGGDVRKAEEFQRKALALDPHFTRARVELARCLIEQARYDDARLELQRVLDEPAPTYHADWAVRHRPKAERLLREIEGKS